VLTHWKEREPSYRNRRTRLTRELGYVPAYATAAAAATTGAEAEPPRRTRRGRVVAPEQPGEEISQEEFEDLVRDLDIEEGRPEVGPQPGRAGAALATRTRDRSKVRPAGDGRAGGPSAAGRRCHPSAARRRCHPGGARPQGQAGAPPQQQAAAQPQTRQETLMGLLGWVMMGLAIWHFTIFLPDRFWGGIVGALIGSLFGAIILGFIISAIHFSVLVPGEKQTDVAVVLYAVPGALLGIAAIYYAGMRREQPA
jgi:hypothetical protein